MKATHLIQTEALPISNRMEWKEISSLLSKTLFRVSKRIRSRSLVAGALSKVFNIPIPDSSVRIKDGVVYLDAHPAVKSQLLIKKRHIMELLREQVGIDINDIK